MAKDISERIKTAYPSFSKGQKKIAGVILHEYDKAAYMTASALGTLAGVSESTVVRFADELGYDGYAAFQRAVQELVRTKLTPNQRIEVTKARMQNGDLLDNVMLADMEKIRYTMEQLDRDAFIGAVDSILSAKNIYIIGARSSEQLARILKYNLSLIFDNVKLITPNSTAEVLEQMFTIDSCDLLVAFSFPRYSTKIVSAVRYANERGARVVAFTDSSISPIADLATYPILAQSDMASYMDSLVAPISLINALIVEITNRREKEITERFDRLEQVWDEYEVYTKR